MIDQRHALASDGLHIVASGAGHRRAEKALLAVALGTVLMGVWRHWATTHRQRLSARPAAKAERLQTWEGEGGRHDPPEATELR